MLSFDELISNGELTKAARLFAKEYYDSGKMGHTRKLLIEVLADKCDKYDEAISRQSVKSEDVAISKTETTSCEWCNSGIDTASVMDANMRMRFVYPVTFCPNCGRRLEEETE